MPEQTAAEAYDEYNQNYTKEEIIWILIDLLAELGEL